MFTVVPIYGAFNLFYQRIVHVDWGVVYDPYVCLSDVYLDTHLPKLSSDDSCSICWSSCGVPVRNNMSSANQI